MKVLWSDKTKIEPLLIRLGGNLEYEKMITLYPITNKNDPEKMHLNNNYAHRNLTASCFHAN